MAMLAEPRQRKRYNLTPRGKPLYNDSDRFGTKMLEKMGWSKGKGLGANEDGSQDFVRVQYKNDFRGMGYEDRDDHWTQHEQSFSALLDNLNDKGDRGKQNDATASDDEMAPRIGFGFVDTAAAAKEEGKKLKEKFSGESLEEKSKRSRARVHYKKFTRGKDLAQYSEKDLANIFGRKESDALQYPQLEAFTANVEPEEESKEEENAEETKQVEHFSGVTTISTGLSLNDYFKQKMEALKKRKMQNGEQTTANETEEAAVNGQSDSQEEEPKKKKKKKAKEYVEENGVEPEEASEPTKKEKKKKKAKESEGLPVSTETSEGLEEESIPKKKKKKNKDSSKDQEADIQEEKEKADENIEEQPTKKKKSKKSKEDVEEVAKEEPQVQADIAEDPPKKKKSKKEKREEIQESVTEPLEEESSKKAKKKKVKEGESVPQQDIEEIPKKKNKDKEEVEELESLTSQESQKKSKKKKNKEKEAAEIITISEEEEEEKPKKKKKDKKKALDTNSSQNDPERSNEKEAKEESADGEPARKAKKKLKESNGDSAEESEGSVADEQAAPPPPNAVSELADDDDPHGPAPLERALQSDNVHIINTFHAELFRFADLPQFAGANIGDVVGYAMHDQMELQIQENPRRDNDVATLWMSCAQSKYDVELRRKRRAKQYTTDVRKLKRKQVFLGI